MSEERIASLTVDGSQAKTELSALAEGFEKLGKSADGAGTALEKNTTRIRAADAEWKRLEQSIPGSTAAMEKFSRLSAQADAALASGRLNAEQHAVAIDRLKSRYTDLSNLHSRVAQSLDHQANAWAGWSRNFNAADAAMARSNMINFAQQVAATGNATAALTVQGPELLGLFTKLPVPVMAAAAAFTVAAGAGVVVASRMAEIGAEGRRLDATLRALNPTLAANGKALRDMAADIGKDTGAGRSDAMAALGAIIKNRAVQSSTLAKQLAALSTDMAAVTGDDVAKTAEKVASAFGKGAAGVRELDKELGFLSPMQAQTIRQLDEAGKRAEAYAVAMGALKDRFGGSVKSMRSEWGEAVHEMGEAWDGFLERVAKSDFATAGARFGRDVLKGWTAWLTPSAAEDPNLKRMREVEKEMTRLSGWLATEMDNGESGAAIDKARKRLQALQTEYYGLAEAIEAARKAQEDFAIGQNYRTGGGGNGGGSGGPPAGMTPDERKHLDGLIAAYDKEREAMRGTAAERSIRLAGLQAEQAALDAGRTAIAAFEERLLAERKARDLLSLSIKDQLDADRLALSSDIALGRARAAGNDVLIAGATAEARRNELLHAGATAAQAAEGAAISYQRSIAALNADLEKMAIDQAMVAKTTAYEFSLLGMQVPERAKLTEEFRVMNELQRRGVDISDDQTQAMIGAGEGDDQKAAAIFMEALQ